MKTEECNITDIHHNNHHHNHHPFINNSNIHNADTTSFTIQSSITEDNTNKGEHFPIYINNSNHLYNNNHNNNTIPSEHHHLLSNQQKTGTGTGTIAPTTIKMNLKLTKYKYLITNRNIKVDILAILFGVGAWMGVNSMFVQLPVLVATAPEGWSLPSFMVIIVQIANIGPLLYTLIQKYSRKKMIDSYLIYCIFIIGCLSAVLMSFFYNRTLIIGSSERSVALLLLAFGLALVGCTSSVLFMPYMGRFRDIYLVTYLIGEGLSGFIASIVALIQGAGGNPECLIQNSTETGQPEIVRYSKPPLFGSQEFFLFVFCMLIISFCAFILLNKLKMCKQEYAIGTFKHGNEYHYDEHNSDKLNHHQMNVDQSNKDNINNNNNNNIDDGNNNSGKMLSNANDGNSATIINKIEKVKKISTFNYKFLLLLMGIVCMFANGIFPAIQSYSCLPYGNVPYHLTVTLSAIANPLACLIAIFLNHTSIRSIIILAVLSAALSCYVLATSVLSPMPPLIGTTIGEFLVVFSWTILYGLISYIKLSITTIFRYQGGKSLVWVGAVTQSGSAIGAILIFCLVNVVNNIFISYDPCASE